MGIATGWFPSARLKFSIELPEAFDERPTMTARNGGAVRCSDFIVDAPDRAAVVLSRAPVSMRTIGGKTVTRRMESPETELLTWETPTWVYWTQIFTADGESNAAVLTEGVAVGDDDPWLDWTGVAGRSRGRVATGDRCTFQSRDARDSVTDIAIARGGAWMDMGRRDIGDRYAEYGVSAGPVSVLVTGRPDASAMVKTTAHEVASAIAFA
jgi:hypothetical protein